MGAVTAFAQKKEKPLVQFTGIVHNADSSQVIIPYASIINLSFRKQGFSSNYKGYFSFVAHEQDTIQFSCVGYSTIKVVIPAGVINKSYTMAVLLKPMIINLPVLRIFPWATVEEFTRDFLSMKIADDDLEIAKKNVSRTSIIALESTLARDGREMQAADGQTMHTNLVNSHSITNPLLNPLSWGSLIQEISAGDKSRTTN